ncbi:hypothetical protein GVX81_09070 [[Haemophilus] felis]|uniref:Uncharacterized protein n=1 Tax=[Haemophilus] felis TaxID=123822 RepID=A0A1T0AW29_9PAST|nr:hypothetical protein [[Haemophilus] felis]OOS01139.1 hypothetical protein B0188_10150 [[Haemophilus] felis]
MKEQKSPFLTLDEMKERYPNLTFVFNFASNALKGIEIKDRKALQRELNQFYKSILKGGKGFSEGAENLPNEQYEQEKKSVLDFIYFASLMNLFAQKLRQEKANDNNKKIEVME